MSLDKVERGLIQRTKVFNTHPQSWSGFAMNTLRPPLDDIRVRKALTFLLNRPLLIDKLFFNEYVPSNTYFPGTVYENPNNPKNPYDPQAAVSLLAEAGWKDRDSQGRLTKNGKPFVIEMLYDGKTARTNPHRLSAGSSESRNHTESAPGDFRDTREIDAPAATVRHGLPGLGRKRISGSRTGISFTVGGAGGQQQHHELQGSSC